jgi:hypothetical protein
MKINKSKKNLEAFFTGEKPVFLITKNFSVSTGYYF